jgi:hypothetical protein
MRSDAGHWLTVLDVSRRQPLWEAWSGTPIIIVSRAKMKKQSALDIVTLDIVKNLDIVKFFVLTKSFFYKISQYSHSQA